jgi:CBS domain containing-hemolysin-like protein
MTFIITIILISTVVSFTCSLLEAVLLSTTRAYIAIQVKMGKRHGLLLERLKEDLNRPLAAILTLNTIAATIGGAAVGSEVQKLYGDAYLATFSAAITVIVLVGGELVPKVIGSSNWKTLAPYCVYLINVFIFIAYPFVWLSGKLGNLLGNEPDALVSREEVIVTAEMGADEGAIRPKESAIIKNLLMLDKMKISDVMTPRAVMYAFESGTTVAEVTNKHRPIRFSRIPVYREDLDHILGVVHRYKILEEVSRDHDSVTIDALMTPIHTIPENISVAAALDQFIKRREHIFIVIDDYGSTTGIMALEDAIETLLGVEIVDEFDSVADLRQHALEQWRDRKARQQGKV